MRPALAWWLCWAALAALLARRVWEDVRQPVLCDTTYLWQGYEQALAADGDGYSLVKFADADASRAAAFRKLQQRHVVPVLFVHGHLGTHQQMRSAAAEMGRELARRLAVDASWPLWLQWYGADFSAEASALDPDLLDRQAAFVLRCIAHLQQVHGAAAAGGQQQGKGPPQERPFRLVLIAYSMGGVVARDALRRLAADPSFDMSQVVGLLTLGSPHHFPQLMPNQPLSALLARRPAGNAAAHSAAAAAAAAVPRANIVAGAADYFLPHTLGGAGAPMRPGERPELSLLMRDVPGVWTTCGHKAIVSCNQLVRQLVPLLVDATAASLEPASSAAQRQAAVQHMLQQRLATNTGAALGLVATPAITTGPAAEAAAVAIKQQQRQQQGAGCAIEQLAAADARPPAPIDSSLLLGRVPAGRLVQLTWDAEELASAGGHGLLLLSHAAQPCTQLSVAAVSGSGERRQLAGAAAALPPLLPGLQQRWVPRQWEDLLHGIDWQQNATRLLYVPFVPFFSGPGNGQLSRVDVALQGSAAGTTALLAQVLDSPPGQQPLQLPPPGSGALELPLDHSAAVLLLLPEHAWPLAAGAGSSSRASLAALLLGRTPPWNLRIEAQHCDESSSASRPGMLPAVVGLAAGAAPADAVRVAAGAQPGSDGAVVQVWDGMLQQSRAGQPQLLVVSHPSCAYRLRLEWDVAGWLGLRLRQLLFVLPTLSIAVSQARLSPLPGATARTAVAAALVAAWGSQHPGTLAALGSSLHPWLQLSGAEALAALLLAAGCASLLGGLQLAGLRMLSAALPSAAMALHTGLLKCLAVLGIATGSLVHPAAATSCGSLCLTLRLAAAAKTDSGKAGRQPSRSALAWLVFYGQLALLPAAGLYSWLASSGQRALLWSDGRALAGLLALHALLLRCDHGGTGAEGGRARRRPGSSGGLGLVRAALLEAAAAAGAGATLWGHPFVLLYTACASAAAWSL